MSVEFDPFGSYDTIFNNKPNKGQLVIYDDEIWQVTGYRFDPAFVDIEHISNDKVVTFPYSHMQILDVTINEINTNKCKNLNDFRILYPEYLI